MKTGFSRLGLVLGGMAVPLQLFLERPGPVAWEVVPMVLVIYMALGWTVGLVLGWALDGFKNKS